MNNPDIFLVFFGGFIVAFLCLLFATFARPTRGSKWLCLIIAFCGLIYEGGCFAVASGVGRATGGGADGSWKNIIAAAFIIAAAWGVTIILPTTTGKRKKTIDKKNSGKNKV